MANGNFLSPGRRADFKSPTDCRLIAQLEAPQDADIEPLQIEAQNALKEKYGKSLTFKPLTEEATEGHLRSDPSPDMGSMDLDSGILLWNLARIN